MHLRFRPVIVLVLAASLAAGACTNTPATITTPTTAAREASPTTQVAVAQFVATATAIPPTQTPIPEPTQTLTSRPTSTPLPMPTNTPLPVPTDTPLPPPTDTPLPPPTDTPVPEPTDTPIPEPTDTPVPEPTDTPTRVPVKPTATATKKAVPATATPVPAVKAPTATPVPETTHQFEGSVKPAVIAAGDKSQQKIALTFDAGAGSEVTKKILDTLRKHHLHVTLFLTGEWAEENPGLVSQMVADGHEIANHSYSHPDFTTKSDDTVINEVQKAERILTNMTGESPRPYLRPPYGAYNTHVVNLLGQMGYYAIMWTFDSGDWRPEYTPQMVFNTVTKKASNGAIVVEHLDSPQSAAVLDQIITNLQGRGFKIVTLSEVLR